MWRVVGENRKTGKTEEVAVADNAAELAIIKREEAPRYKDLRGVSMSMPLGERRDRRART